MPSTRRARAGFFQKTKALARNADPEHHGFFRSCFPQKRKAPAGNADLDITAFSGHVFPKKQKPLLGTPILSTTAFFRSCFSQKTKAPARNADTSTTAFSGHVFPPQKKLLGTPTPNTKACVRSCFFQKTKAPARNADPNTTAFSGYVLPRKQEPLLGMLIRDEYLMCPTCPAGAMVAEKKSLHFWAQIATKVAKHVAEPILAPESRFRGIRGAICIIFRDLSVPTGPGGPGRGQR
jgi:hypothetical protein